MSPFRSALGAFSVTLEIPRGSHIEHRWWLHLMRWNFSLKWVVMTLIGGRRRPRIGRRSHSWLCIPLIDSSWNNKATTSPLPSWNHEHFAASFCFNLNLMLSSEAFWRAQSFAFSRMGIVEDRAMRRQQMTSMEARSSKSRSMGQSRSRRIYQMMTSSCYGKQDNANGWL